MKKTRNKKATSSIKKLRYHIYQSMLGFIASKAKIKGTFKEKEREALYLLMNGASEADFANISLENRWRELGSKAIFPESVDLLEVLRKSTFSTTSLGLITYPFESFSVAIPKGYTINGLEIPSFLVDYSSDNDFFNAKERMAEKAKFCADISVDRLFDVNDPDVNEKQLMIIYKDPDSGIRMSYRAPLFLVEKTLKAKTFEEFLAILDEHTDLNHDDFKDRKRNQEYSFHLSRLVIALSVYIQANQDRNTHKLLKGLPGMNIKELDQMSVLDNSKQHFVVKSTEQINQKKAPTNKTSTHYRSFHFRNLVHEKYYRNENESKPRGSRWVFVKDTLINAAVDPNTLIE